MEKMENLYKEVTLGRNPTVVPPNEYADRFIAAMKSYFI
jgi:hypothetical protein